MSNIGLSIQIMNAISSICTLRRWNKQRATHTPRSTVSSKSEKSWVSFQYLHFADSQLVATCIDFILPSLNAISVTLQFLLQRFQLQPEILKKCQNEIDQVVGQGRLPSLDDRIKWVYQYIEADLHLLILPWFSLPYMEATLRESMRHETLIPNGLPHSALVDTKFMGYDIPKVIY